MFGSPYAVFLLREHFRSIPDDLIDAARQLAEEAVRLDPERTVPGFADAVTQTNLLAGEEWIDRS